MYSQSEVIIVQPGISWLSWVLTFSLPDNHAMPQVLLLERERLFPQKRTVFGVTVC